MPDWSYRTVFRPILFQLPPKLARDLALGCMGTLARMPWGPNIIDFMGHMRPDNRLACRLGDRTFPTRIGLAACVDPQLRAARAFAQFGIAFSEIGPITINGESEGPIHRDDVRETLRFEFPPASPSLATVLDELERTGHVPAYVRLILPSGPEGDTPDLQTIIVKLGERPAGYIMQSGKLADAAQSIGRTVELAREHGVGVMLVAVSADACEADIVTVKALAQSGMIQGVFVDGSVVDTAQSRTVGKPASLLTPQAVRIWREQLPCGALIIAEGGVHEPLQALELVRAGCDLICVSSGLIFTGPGLIKRINEALLFELPESTDIRPSPEELSWFWTCLIAVGMLLGGTMALIIATTRVVMPYDEATVGLTRSEICAINPQL